MQHPSPELKLFRGQVCAVEEVIADGLKLRALRGQPFLKEYINPVTWRHVDVTTASADEVQPFEKTTEIERLERERDTLEAERDRLSNAADAWEWGSAEKTSALDDYFEKCDQVRMKLDELDDAYDRATDQNAHDSDDWADQQESERP